MDLDQALGDGLIEKLIRQQRLQRERAENDGWMACDNFADYYDANKHLFVVTYSRAERLAARILQLYVTRQLSGMLQREGGLPEMQDGWDRVNDVVRAAIDNDAPRLLGLLKDVWPAQYSAIEALNNSNATVR